MYRISKSRFSLGIICFSTFLSVNSQTLSNFKFGNLLIALMSFKFIQFLNVNSSNFSSFEIDSGIY